MKPFEYVIMWTPTEEQKKEGKKPLMISTIKTVLADTPDQVKITAAIDIPDGYKDQVDQITILVRPFC